MIETNKIEVETRCRHVRDSHVVPGWGCCKCHTYNGYQREKCWNCGHVPCYETGSPEGKEAIELKPIGGDQSRVLEYLARHPLACRKSTRQ
jgi:hypothetical protein